MNGADPRPALLAALELAVLRSGGRWRPGCALVDHPGALRPAACGAVPCSPMPPPHGASLGLRIPPVHPAWSCWPAAVRWRPPAPTAPGAPLCPHGRRGGGGFPNVPASPACPGRRWLAGSAPWLSLGGPMITGGFCGAVLVDAEGWAWFVQPSVRSGSCDAFAQPGDRGDFSASSMRLDEPLRQWGTRCSSLRGLNSGCPCWQRPWLWPVSGH